jgi:N-acetylglucosaminyldiphosphoundecaprenol N-acetyl-beta-D-mannosaminyltransferase
LLIAEKGPNVVKAEIDPFLPPRAQVLGVPISVVDMETAMATIALWIRQKKTRYVCAPDVYNVVRAQDDPKHMAALQSADLVIPDGTPLTWVMRLRGEKIRERVCGPDLMLAVCRQSAAEGWRHYFYGGADGVASELAHNLKQRFPGLQVAGLDCPPFRPLSETEVSATIEMINAAKPDIVWVGLGCPKQELWMAENRGRIEGAVLLGVGAAFDFHTGRVRRAPAWMQTHGLEWLYRLAAEPGRLWRRYLVSAPRFCLASLAETIRLKFPMTRRAH